MSRLAIYATAVCISLSMVFAAESIGQRKLLKDIPIDIDLKESMALQDVIDEVENSGQFTFVYSKRDIRGITIEFTNPVVSMEQLLNEISIQARVSIKRVNETISFKNVVTDVVMPQLFEEIPDQQSVTGKVTDENGEGLPGASILEKGTTNGTITDVDGNFSLNVPENAILTVSFVGYESMEVPLNGRSYLDISLTTDISSLEEVVVVGYGSTKKSDLTGSVSQVSNEELEQVPTYNLEQAMKGRAPGVVVRQNSGSPGGRMEVRIRGGNSMVGSKEPLYVVDGFPITGDISFLNPSDIESVDILKDASATAIYGARGANGVVMITSKRGKSGQANNIEINSISGVQVEANRYEMFDARQYAEVVNEYLTNSSQQPFFDLNDVQGPGTNWQDLIFQNALLNNHTITFSGSTQKSNFSLSGNLYDQQGIVKHSGATKGSLRLNMDREFNEVISLGVNLNLSRRQVDNLDQGFDPQLSIIGFALGAPPTLPVYDSDGIPTRPNVEYDFANPNFVSPATFFPPFRRRRVENTVIGNMALKINLAEGLSFKTTAGLEYANVFQDNFTPIIYPNDRGSGSRSTSFQNSVLLENILTYQKSFSEQHDLNLTAGYTYQTFENQSFGIGVSGFSNNTTENYDLGGAETINNPSSGYSDWTLASWIGRANYTLNQKYLFTASFRADGSSRFGANNKWGFFPSGAIGWRVSEEPFMQNITSISSLKLRASYGVTGNTAILPYESLNRLASAKYVYGNQAEAIGYVPVSIPNPDLKWESTAQVDVGFDLSMFDYRFRVSLDYYRKNTSDLLSAVVLPPSSGFETSIKNVGEMENQGLELSVGGDIFVSDFKWDGNLVISGNRNKIVSLAGGADILGQRIPVFNRVTIAREGEPLQSFYGYREDGLDDEGHIKYQDINGDGQIDPDDLTIIGNPFPDFIFGLNNNFSFKNFELNLFIEGVSGNDLWWGTAGTYLNSFQSNVNQLADLYGNYWTAENPDPNAKYPKIEPGTDERNTDRYVKDGSYIRLKSLRLAYNVPTDNISWLGKTQVFISGNNLITLTNYPGIDPDVNSYGSDSQNVSARNQGGWLTSGIDFMSYPVSRLYSVGMKLNF